MDLNKKVALIKWLDALSITKVNNFDDLRDFQVITDILSECGEIFPDGHGTDAPGRLASIKKYTEAFYHQTFDDNSLINYEILASNIRGDKYVLEMGKLLLVLLGCVIQDEKTKDKFVAPALTLDEQSQYELKEMIEHILFMNDTETCIQPGFAEVLKRKTVADGGIKDSPRVPKGTPNASSRSHDGPPVQSLATMYSNSPGSPANTSGYNIRDISSPLRVMSLSSPVTPLSALMHSPQLAQKALLRHKDKEIKKLGSELQEEKHLREEIEQDLSDRVVEITQKEFKIRELERQLGESRQIRDQIDELDSIRAERDQLASRVTELQNRLVEQTDIRGQNQLLERESHSMIKELAAAREEVKMLSSLKRDNEEYNLQSHKQQLKITELEASLEHQNNVVQSLRSQLEESQNIRQVYQDQYNTMKQEKEQLEEMFGANQANMMSGGIMYANGESMNVVTEKRLSELQAEYDQIKTNWVQPHEYDSVKKQLAHEQEAKKTYEERYIDTKKDLLKCEEEIERLRSNVQQYQNRVENLEESLNTSNVQCRGLENDLSTIREEKQLLLESEQQLTQVKDANESTIRELKDRVSELQTEIQFAKTEVELQKTASEKRRLTIVQLDQEKIQTQNSEQKLTSEIKSLKTETATLQDQLRTVKEDFKKKEQNLKESIASLEKANDELEYDKHHQTNELKVLRQKVTDFKLDIAEMSSRLEEEKDNGAKIVKRLESELKEERSNLEQSKVSLRDITSEYEEYKISLESKVDNLDSQIASLAKEKKTVDLELQSAKFELENTKVSSDAKCQKLDTMFADRENRLKLEIVSLNSEKEELERGKLSLYSELSSAKDLSARQKTELLELNNYIAQLKASIVDLNNDIDASKSVVIEHQQQIKTLNTKLQQETEQNDLSINSLKEEIELLKTQHKAEIKRVELHSEHQLKELTDKYKTADRLFQENIGQWMQSMETIKESHSHEVKALKKAIEEKESKYQIKSADYKDMEKSFWSALSGIEMDYLSMKNMASENKLLKEELENVCVEKDSEISSLNDKLSELEEKIARDLQEAGNNALTLSEEKKNIQTQFCEYKQETSSNIAALQNKLSQLESDLVEEKQNYQQLVEEKSEVQSQLTQMTQTMEAKLNESETKMEELLCVLQTERIDTQKLKDEKANVESQLELFKKESDSTIVETNAKICKLQSELEEQNVVYVKLSEERATIVAQFEQLKQESKELETQQSSLMSELEKERESVQLLSEEKASVVSQIAQLKQESDAMNSQSESNQSKLQTELEQQKTVVCQLTEEKSHMESELSQFKQVTEAKIAEQESLVSKLKSELEQERNNIHQLVEEKSTTETQLEQLKHESEAKRIESESYQAKLLSELEEQKSIVCQLTEQKSAVESQLEQVKQQNAATHAESESMVSKLQNEIEEHRKNIQQLTEDKSAIQAEFTRHLEECSVDIAGKDEMLAQLRSEIEEQRVNYQQLMCGMEEKLGGENGDLKERLSQMKCQYDTLIKSKEEDVKKISKANEALNSQKANIETQFESMKSQHEELVKQLESVANEKTDIQNKLDIVVDKKNKLDEEFSNCQVELSDCRKELMVSQSECKRVSEELSHEKGERDDVKRQLEYTQDRTDTLTAELSSQQQQLAAVEEEKRQLESQISELINSNSTQLEQMQEQVNSDRHRLEIEKEELERQLQSSQKCFEAVKKENGELAQNLEKSQFDYNRLDERSRESERRLGAFLEKERHLMEDLQHLRDRNTELNNNLQTQLKDFSSLQESNNLLRREVENTRQHQREKDARYERDIQKLTEEKTAMEIKNAELSEVEKVLRNTEAERQKLQDINDSYKSHYNKKKEIIAQQNEKMAEMNKEIDYYKRMEEKLTSEHAPLQDKLNLEIVKNKNLASKVRTLEAQNDLAERKLREYKQQLDKGGSVFLGDPSDFQKMLSVRENTHEASFMENHPSSVPLDDSIFMNENETTLTPNTRASQGRRRMSKSASTATVSSIDNADTVSIGSATSLAYRLRSRESAASLNRSINSFDSCKTNSSVPRGTGGIFHCEDEPPMDFEWGRLGELSRRNTMCPSHLKTSYPVETQQYKPNRFREDALRESTISNKTVIPQQPGSGRKRKQGWDSTDSGTDSADSKSSKQAKTVYQKPGPPTPRNSRRSSKGSKSPSVRRHSGRSSVSSRSPNTPQSQRGRRGTPRRTPKANTPRRGAGVETRSNQGSGKKTGRRDSVAFNVGFSPLSMGRSSRLKRQQAFIQKQPEGSTKVSRLVSMFEKDHSASKSVEKHVPRFSTPRNLQAEFDMKDSAIELSHSRISARSDQKRNPVQDYNNSYNASNRLNIPYSSTNANELSHSRISARSEQKRNQTKDYNGSYVSNRLEIPFSSTPYQQHNNVQKHPRSDFSYNVTSVSNSPPSDRYDFCSSHSPVLRDSTMPKSPCIAYNPVERPPLVERLPPVERPPPVPRQQPSQPRSKSFTPRLALIPSFNTERAEHIYEEISDLDLDIQDRLNKNKFRSDSQIRHLSSSPDFVRQSIRKKLPEVDQDQELSSSNQLSIPSANVSDRKGTPRRPTISRVKVHGHDMSSPSPAFNSVDRIKSKPPYVGTPKNLMNKLVSKFKITPKKSKFAKSLKFDDNQF